MARRPRNHHGNPWSDFFLSFVRTPRRLGLTLIGAFVLLVGVNPYGAAVVLNYLLNHVLLVLAPVLLMIGILLWGFRMMFKPFMPKKKKKGGH